MTFKLFFAIVCVFFLGHSEAQTLCFRSNSVHGKAIRLQLVLPEDDSSKASIRYEMGTSDLQLIRAHEEVQAPKNQVPAVVKTTFVEMSNGKKSGEYYLTTQGGIVGDMVYFSLKNGKKFVFFEDLESSTSGNCSWLSSSK